MPVGGVIGVKIFIDFSFQLWAIHLYRRWLGDRSAASFGHAFVASIIEPFSFQLLRHLGAVWGWVVFLGGRRAGGSQRRVGVLGPWTQVQVKICGLSTEAAVHTAANSGADMIGLVFFPPSPRNVSLVRGSRACGGRPYRRREGRRGAGGCAQGAVGAADGRTWRRT